MTARQKSSKAKGGGQGAYFAPSPPSGIADSEKNSDPGFQNLANDSTELKSEKKGATNERVFRIVMESPKVPQGKFSAEIRAAVDAFSAAFRLLLIVVVLYALIAYQSDMRRLLSRITSVKIPGVEAQFMQREFADKLEAVRVRLNDDAAERMKYQISSSTELSAVLARLNVLSNVIANERILWVDDHPANNVPIVQVLKSVHVDVWTASSNEEARETLNVLGSVDLVISDIGRDQAGDSGLALPSELSGLQKALPVVFFVGSTNRTLPQGAVAITKDVVQLLNVTCDQLERSSFQKHVANVKP